MPLIKEICKRCIDGKFPLYPWQKDDEERWLDGCVDCGQGIGKKAVKEGAHVKCRLILEQVVLSQEKRLCH